MREVHLVNGCIPVSEMGFCSVHEHVMPHPCLPEYREHTIKYAVERLHNAYALGLRTIVDVSPWGEAGMLKEIAEQAPVQIICCTGFYTRLDGLSLYSADDFASHMLREIDHGVQGSGIIPGVIKIASTKAQPVGLEMRALQAAGRVQGKTGIPLCVHSVTGCQHQQAILGDSGADLSRVYFSHVEAAQGWEGRSLAEEIELLKQVLSHGSYLSFNNFGNWSHTPEDCMASLITALVEAGYADRLLATMDFVWSYREGKPCVLWEDICEEGDRRDYAYLLSHVQPWMRKRGIPEKVIHMMNHENPAQLFG